MEIGKELDDVLTFRIMKSSDRPLSPHLQIYKPQITSGLSILHRLTGIYLSFGIFIIIYWIASVSLGEAFYNFSLSILKSSIAKLLYGFWFFCFSYHLFNGIRHIFWDIGIGFSHKEIFYSGIVVILLSIISASSLIFLFL